MTTDNFRKHTVSFSLKQFSFLQKLLIGRFLDKVVEIAAPLSVSSILDVGCGEGFTLARLKQAHIGKKLQGIEYLDRAIELGKKYNPTIAIKKGTIYDLPYKANSFDLVLCTEVLEHLEDPKRALAELKRVANRYILLSVPNEPWFMLGNFLRGKNLRRWGNDIEHINHWSAQKFEKFVGKQLTILQTYHPLPWTIILAKK